MFIRIFLSILILIQLSTEAVGQDNVSWTNSWPRKNDIEAGYERIPRIKYKIVFKSIGQIDKYHHHPGIAFYDSVLFVSWSSSLRDEDSPGQSAWFSYSVDETNRKWEPALMLFPPHDNNKPRGNMGRVLTPLGFGKIGDLIYAVAEVFDWTKYEERDGKGRVARSVGPTGELGEIFWLVENPPEPLAGFPAYPGAENPEYSEIANKLNNWLNDPLNSPAWEFKNNSTRPIAFDGHQMCEMTKAVVLPDGNYLRMYRDCNGRLRNYVQISEDGGVTWDKAKSTNIPDSNSKSYLGSLPDGTVYMINNAIDELWDRDPLSIALMNNDHEFSWVGNIKYGAPKVRFEGMSKEPGFQYPSAVTTEKYLWVIYSVGKEDIEVARVLISSLPDEIP